MALRTQFSPAKAAGRDRNSGGSAAPRKPPSGQLIALVNTHLRCLLVLVSDCDVMLDRLHALTGQSADDRDNDDDDDDDFDDVHIFFFSLQSSTV